MKRTPWKCLWLTVALALATVQPAVTHARDRSDKLQKIKHFVVIYQENHSFDNLFGGWESVRGLADADSAHTLQFSQTGNPFFCLMQDDVNLTSPPLATICSEPGYGFSSAFVNKPFKIDSYIAATDKTCPPPGVFLPNGEPKDAPGALPGGCTRDLVHRFYQEQYQLDGGKMDSYMVGSDAVGLVMGYFDTRSLPIYLYLHSPGAPKYAVADNFFQAAFGGSFLNHQWLVAAASPFFAGAVQDGGAQDLHSVLDVDGFPNSSYLLYKPATAVKDLQLTSKCPAPLNLACGDFAVNTTQPWFQPFSPGTADFRRLRPISNPTIGDRLSAAGIDWAWYSGGWSNANGDIGGPGWTNGNGPGCTDPETISGAVFPNCPNALFQFHHQAFNYFAAFDPGTQQGLANRQAHLRDEVEFEQLASSSTRKVCNLKPVSFIKPVGAENEHPGYGSEGNGSRHLVDLIKAIRESACAKDTMIIVTYDEFGGQWDHVPPPGQGSGNGPHDEWGPGTRIPALVVSPFLRGDFVVDHALYDTTSIIATLEDRYGLAPLGGRDAAVNSLGNVFNAK